MLMSLSHECKQSVTSSVEWINAAGGTLAASVVLSHLITLISVSGKRPNDM